MDDPRTAEEQDADARPATAGEAPDLTAYDVVLLASPICNVHPVVTYAVSGLGTAEQDHRDACPGATIARGLAVQGEEVRDAGPDVERWLTEVGLTPA